MLKPPRIPMIGRWSLVCLALALALFLRLWRLESLPPGLYHDEAYNGLDALSLVRGETFPRFYEGWELYAQEAHDPHPAEETRFPVFFEGNYGREPLHVYSMAISIRLFGATPFALRLVPALAGALAVWTTYLAAASLLRPHEDSGKQAASRNREESFGSGVPVIAAFLMAILYPAVHFSRFGIRAMLFVPLETLTVYCFWSGIAAMRGRGSRLKTNIWFALAGVFLGLGFYTYAAARLFPLLFAGFAFLWFWQDRPSLAIYWRSLVIMVAVTVVVSLPLLLFFMRYPYYFVFRIAYVANKGKGTIEGSPGLTWLLNLGRVVRGLFWQGETHLRHNLPGRPYLDPMQSVLFWLGSWLALRGWREKSHAFLLLWLVVMLLPTVLSGDAPHFGRMSGAAPALAILAATGAEHIHTWVRDRLMILPAPTGRSGNRRPRFLSFTLLAGLLLVSTLLTVRDYFGRYGSQPDLERDFYLTDWELGQFAAEQGKDARLYMTPAQAEMATIYFALNDPERLQSYNGGDGLIPAGEPGVPSLYLVREQEEAGLRFLADYFPDGRQGSTVAGYVSFYVPAESPRMKVENLSDFSWEGKIALAGWSADHAGDGLAVRLAWRAQSDVGKDYTAYVHLLDQDGVLVAQLDRQPAGYPTSTWQSGEIVVDRFLIELPATIPPGEYALQTGWYEWPSLDPLGRAAVLGTVAIDRDE